MVRRSTWILLAVLGVLAVGFAVWQRTQRTGTEEPPAGNETLWDIPTDQIQSVRVQNLSTGDFVLVRRDPELGWKLVAPDPGPGDSGRIEMGVASLASLRIRQRFDRPSNLDGFRLNPPSDRLTLILADGTSRSIEIGGTDPTGTVYYVRLPGTPEVLMVGRSTLEEALGWLAERPAAQPTVGMEPTP